MWYGEWMAGYGLENGCDLGMDGWMWFGEWLGVDDGWMWFG